MPAPDSRLARRLADPAWLHDQHITRRRTLAAIAADLGCPTSYVRSALIAAGIPCHTYQPSRLPAADRDDTLARYRAGDTQTAIAADHGVCKQAIQDRIHRFAQPADRAAHAAARAARRSAPRP